MKEIFSFCVWLLNKVAMITGLSYEAVNVLIFCVIGPAMMLFLLLKWIEWKRGAKEWQELYFMAARYINKWLQPGRIPLITAPPPDPLYKGVSSFRSSKEQTREGEVLVCDWCGYEEHSNDCPAKHSAKHAKFIPKSQYKPKEFRKG